MTRSDLIDHIHGMNRLRQANLPARAAREILEGLLDFIRGGFLAGKPLALRGLGSFRVVKRKARSGRNPKTGAAIQIPARRSLRFRPSGELLKR